MPYVGLPDDADISSIPAGGYAGLPDDAIAPTLSRKDQVAKGASMTPKEASDYMAQRAAFASQGGVKMFAKAPATDTRKISYTDTGYKPNKPATSLKEFAKNAVQDVVEAPLFPVHIASDIINAPDTLDAVKDTAKSLVTTPLGFVPYVSEMATGRTAADNWLTNPGLGAMTVLGGAELARHGGPKVADFAVDKLTSTEALNPKNLARSALKPYNGEQVARQKAVTKGLETAVSDPNATPRMSKFLEKNLAEMDEIAGRQEVLLDDKGNPRVSIKGVRDSLQGTVDAARETPGTADSAVSAAGRVLDDILNHPEYDAATDTIPLNTVQTMKKNIWRKLRDGNTFNKDAVPGLQDAMWDAATGMNSIINEFIPEMKAENARYGELANVNKILKKAADRHAGNNLIPLRAMIQLVRGDVQGFMQGATMWAVDHPTFKMYLAQRLAKARGKGVTPREVNTIADGIKSELVRRNQTVLDSESLPKVSNGNLGDAIPGGQGLAYGWEGKPSTLTGEPVGAAVANPEALPPAQSGVGDTITGGFQREVGWDGKPLPLTEQPTGPVVLNPESLPRNSRSNMGDATPNGYQREYGWEGKQATPMVANPEALPPRQSSQMPQLSEQGGRIVPHVEAMTPRVPEGFNPEVLVGNESQLGDRLAPQPHPLRNLPENNGNGGGQIPPVAGLSESVDTSVSPASGKIADIRPQGWNAAGDVVGTLTREGKLYRGMTQEEFDATVGKGAGIKSRQDYSVNNEGTSFADNASDAESYVNYGRHDPRKTGKPTYLLEIDQGPDVVLDRDGYYKAASEMPNSRITRIIKMDAENGAIVGYEQPTGSAPSSPAAHTWQSYLAAHMSRAMKETGDHGKAMKLLGEEWRKDKSKDPLDIRGGKK